MPDLFKKTKDKQKAREEKQKLAEKEANREWIRKESEAMLAKGIIEREKTKQRMFETRMERDQIYATSREARDKKWLEKTKSNPLAINLVSEEDRVYEETLMRTRADNARREKISRDKDAAKNEIILKALSEFSDLEALRKERRAILDEEQRLKALLALEKVTVSGKEDRIVAERAQKQRKEAKFNYRRTTYKDSLDRVVEEERNALIRKHGLTKPEGYIPDMYIPVLNTFTEVGS